MTKENTDTDFLPVTLSQVTLDYLGELVKQGTHGTTLPGVARTLIEKGIRQAIEQGFLKPRKLVEPIEMEDLP